MKFSIASDRERKVEQARIQDAGLVTQKWLFR